MLLNMNFFMIFQLLVLLCFQNVFSQTGFEKINPPVNISAIHSYFAICAVVKNEQKEDLREWVEYHYRMGCGKFYIHDNGDISVEQMLADYVQRGIVVVQERKETNVQLSIYHRCIRNYRTFHRWIGLIDADEFIVTKSGCSIPSVLRKYEGYGGLTLNWKVFCSSGHVSRPPNAILRNYWACYDYNHFKTIANTDFAVSHYGNPHLCHYSHGKFSVDTDFLKVAHPYNPPRPTLFEVMYLHHYHLKSKEDFDRNRKRGVADGSDPHRKNEAYFKRVDGYCNKNCSVLSMPPGMARDCSLETFRNIRPISLF